MKLLKGKTDKLSSVFFVIILLLYSGLLVSCSKKDIVPSGSGYRETENTKRVMDMTGSFIKMPKEINSVIWDAASAATLVITLGAVDKLAVLSTSFSGETFAWLNLVCPDVMNVVKDDTPFKNIESALAYEPDLAIVTTKANIEQYKNVGIPVIYISFSDYDSCKQSMGIIGSALGENELAAAIRYNDFLDENIALVMQRLSNLNDTDKKTVYYMDSRFNDLYHTVGVGEIQETWIKLAGGKFATDDLSGRDLLITTEKILSIDPDIIFIGSGGQNPAAIQELLKSDATLADLKAVKNNDIVIMPRGIFAWCRTGPEFCMQMVWAAKLLYPDIYEDIDIVKMAKDFYFNFYGTDVSDENIAKIFAGKVSPTDG